VAGGSGLAVPAHARTASALESAFDAAAGTHGVPRDLLVALGYSETHLVSNHGPSQSNGFGIMHLVDNPVHQTLAEASGLTGASPEALKSDPVTNIDGAAAVLRAYADDAGLSSAARGEIGAWYPVVARYSGSSNPSVARFYADGVYDVVVTGAQTSDVTLEPTGVEADRESLDDDDGGMTIMSHNEYPPARWVAAHSSNYTTANRPSSHPINYVIIHVAQGTYAGTISWFQNSSSNVSTHYVMRSSDGAITQMVHHKDWAWHAGNSTYNQRSIGIEHEGWVNDPSWFTDAMYRASGAWCRWVCDRHGIPKTRARIIGHNEVPGATHTDPGPHWNWTRYMQEVTGGGGDVTWQTTIDNSDSRFSASGNWGTSTWSSQKHGADYRFANPEPVSDAAWYRANLPSSGNYRVQVWYPANSGYNDRTPYVVVTPSGNQTVHVNQRITGGQWRTLGTWAMNAGERNVVGVSRWTNGVGYVIADAVRIQRIE
jgi:N-acetyl-anhydromuramyl-L-alanine amidase AmpD